MGKQINQIIDRNKKVESDKAWETSNTRKFIIAGITYIFACLFLIVTGNKNPYLNALIPTAGFLLSTLSMPFIKKWWINSIYKK